MVNWRRRQRVVLGAAFAASVGASSIFLDVVPVLRTGPVTQQLLLIFVFPVTACALYLIVPMLQKRQRLFADSLETDVAVEIITFWVLLFLAAAHVLVLIMLMDVPSFRPWAPRVGAAMIGVTLIAVGNSLPRTRPNLAIGIRTLRTLADRGLWMLIHRRGGYVLVALGLLIVLSAAFNLP